MRTQQQTPSACDGTDDGQEASPSPAVTSKTGARRVTGTSKHSSQKGWDARPHFLDLLQVVGHLIDLAFAVVDAPVQRFLQQTDTHIAKRRPA